MTLKPINDGPIIAIWEKAVPEGEESLVNVAVVPGLKTLLFAGEVTINDDGVWARAAWAFSNKQSIPNTGIRTANVRELPIGIIGIRGPLWIKVVKRRVCIWGIQKRDNLIYDRGAVQNGGTGETQTLEPG